MRWFAGFVFPYTVNYVAFFSRTEVTALHKNEVFIKDFFSKCDQIRNFLRNWSYLLKKLLMENLIFCAVMDSAALQYHSSDKDNFYFEGFLRCQVWTYFKWKREKHGNEVWVGSFFKGTINKYVSVCSVRYKVFGVGKFCMSLKNE